MKKQLLLGGLTIWTFASFGESSDAVLQMHYRNTSGEQGVSIFHYNSEGRNHYTCWSLLDGSRWSDNWHSFDSEGHMVQKDRAFSDGMTSCERFVYDGKCRLKQELFERSDGVSGTAIYTYDDEGKSYHMSCDRYKGWLTAEIDIQLDGEGRAFTGSLWHEGQPYGSISYTYNSRGQLVKELWRIGEQWWQEFTFTYQGERKESNAITRWDFTSANAFLYFNNPQYRISSESYDYNRESGGPSSFIYSVEEPAQLIEKTFERSDGLKTTTEYTYAEDGRLIHSTRNYADGRSTLFSYDYTPDRLLLSRTMKGSDGSVGSEQFSYSSEGELISAIYENMDGWLSGELSFECDDFGRPATADFRSDKASANISFIYTPESNLSLVHWSFSFDATQTYRFFYERLPGGGNSD